MHPGIQTLGSSKASGGDLQTFLKNLSKVFQGFRVTPQNRKGNPILENTRSSCPQWYNIQTVSYP